ncbi:hypothetical protein B0H16DRAFT_1518648 [Mycena metata]|uniref:F-box domain-containing protein n=1 Tax=Mycena metata TaxID=1033252 RepID=A0AAD7JPZ7_9AGAR|nr:hypothetical protein B0H16DRAFT_1518648 [Mycena metata]
MGQYWKVVNLDKSVTYGGWGKLGEFLFSLPGCIANSLYGGFKLPELDAMILSFKPGKLKIGMRYVLILPETAARSPQETTLLNLPVDVLHEIYSHVDSFVGVVCLSATCQVLWDVGRRSIYRQIAAAAAKYSWAGDRIVCIGDYLEHEDIPDHIFTSEEKTKFLGSTDRLYSYPFDQIGSDGFSLLQFWIHCGVAERLSCIRSENADAVTTPNLLILRNLSRHQYVPESALLHLQAECGIGFGEVVMSRICLSSDPSASIAYRGEIHRGAWAGDRFDVVEDSEALREDTAWLDVGEEVLKEVEAIWKA